MGQVKLLDCTLRDGGYVNKWNFGEEIIKGIMERLALAEIDLIECGFLTDKPVDDDHTLFAQASDVNRYIGSPAPGILYVAMIAIGEKEIHPSKICDAEDTYIGGIRLTFHMNELKKAFEWAGIIKKKGYKVFMQPVGSANYSDADILELVKKVNQLRPYAFYIVDTLGAMSVKDMMHMLHIVDRNLAENINLGYHSHNNLQLAFANAQRMIEFDVERDIIIDCSVYGMGRGAGNLCTELMIDYMRMHKDMKYDVLPVLEIVDNYLLPIYMRSPWGYSVAYFLASSLDCHPNYVSYFMDKQNTPVRAIRSLLAQIPEDKRLTYHQDIIEQIYLDYQNNAINDREEILKLRKELKSKNILVVGSGRTVKTKRNKIDKYIEKNHPFVISVNFQPDFPVDMIFMANQKRYELVKGVLDSDKTIYTSNIKGINEKDRVVNYSDLLNGGGAVSDSSGLMLLRLLIRAKVKNVLLVGMDGFKKNPMDNYCDKRFVHPEEKESVKNRNYQMKEQINMLRKEMGMEFITPSKYDDK